MIDLDNQWSVEVDVEVGVELPFEEWADDVFELLEGASPALSYRAGIAQVTIAVDHLGDGLPDVRWAVSIAVDRVTTALDKCGLEPGRVVHVGAETFAALDARLAEPTIPALIGVAELAETLGVTKQRASALARSAGFPLPIAELAAGPIWAEPMVRRFVEEWERRPGRPRTVAAP